LLFGFTVANLGLHEGTTQSADGPLMITRKRALPTATSNACPAFVDPPGRYASLDA
jgi:hypothetical protein